MATDTPPANRSQGRKKIEMNLIKKKTARMVTFSKRRASLFRKASELATLCNAHLAIMIFSPGGKIYSFGHPTVEAVLERYESSNGVGKPNHFNRTEFMRLAAVKAENALRLKMELQQIHEDIQAKKEKIKMLDMVWEKDHATRYWWNAPVEEMDMAWCKALEEKLMDLRMEVEAELKNRNQDEKDSKKSVIKEATPGKQMAASNRSIDVLPNNIVAGWINYAAQSAHNFKSGPNIAAARACDMSNFHGTEFYNFVGGTSNSTTTTSTGTAIGRGLSPKSYGAGPKSTNFNNFPF